MAQLAAMRCGAVRRANDGSRATSSHAAAAAPAGRRRSAGALAPSTARRKPVRFQRQPPPMSRQAKRQLIQTVHPPSTRRFEARDSSPAQTRLPCGTREDLLRAASSRT